MKDSEKEKFYKNKRMANEMLNEREIDKYLIYSFKKDFLINGIEKNQIFEPSKILGDLFEAIMGAIFIDGGIKEVLRVY